MKSWSLKNLLELVLAQPTAPFRESWVMAAVEFFCHQNGIASFRDDFDNIWVNATKKSLKTKDRVFVAHMDHPGIVIESFKKKGKSILAYGKWLGGGPKNIQGFPVQVFSHIDALSVLEGRILSHTSNGARGPDEVVIKILDDHLAHAVCTKQGLKALGPWGACLWFHKQGVGSGIRFDDKTDKIFTKAADDLAGVCALLFALLKGGAKSSAILLTRAEENGFHGTLEVLRLNMLNPRKVKMISIENSSRLPGAIPGAGPVIRLGDRMSVFNEELVSWIETQALALRGKKSGGFTYQKKLMDGGACEATAFKAFDFDVAGISLPLENYHNQYLPVELLGGKKAPARLAESAHPEMIRMGDLEKLISLLEKLYASKIKSSPSRALRGKLLDGHADVCKKYR